MVVIAFAKVSLFLSLVLGFICHAHASALDEVNGRLPTDCMNVLIRVKEGALPYAYSVEYNKLILNGQDPDRVIALDDRRVDIELQASRVLPTFSFLNRKHTGLDAQNIHGILSGEIKGEGLFVNIFKDQDFIVGLNKLIRRNLMTLNTLIMTKPEIFKDFSDEVLAVVLYRLFEFEVEGASTIDKSNLEFLAQIRARYAEKMIERFKTAQNLAEHLRQYSSYMINDSRPSHPKQVVPVFAAAVNYLRLFGLDPSQVPNLVEKKK